MKSRWMKSVIETSRKPAPPLPFQRQARPTKADRAQTPPAALLRRA